MPPQLSILLKALRELGPTQLGLLALYKTGIKIGHYKKQTSGSIPYTTELIRALHPMPSRETLLANLGEAGLKTLLAQADEIVEGHYQQFGGDLVEINLKPPSTAHWAELESAVHLATTDIKFTWEPARFGWAFALGRAWLASGNERYPAAFWRYFEQFQAENPPFLGENWMSAQEVGIRLMAFTWLGQIFVNSEHTTLQRITALSASVAAHAERIPPTLAYARAQNNNHLLSEAAALYTASLALPEHPQATRWNKLGKTWLNWCFTHQIDSTGEYIQHSANYHRLMLQIALWVNAISNPRRERSSRLTPEYMQGYNEPPLEFPQKPWQPSALIRENLALATHWLYCLLDMDSGGAPNLGPNDGAYLFPLTNQPIHDYRPVVQAAARAFLGYSLPPGPWDEMTLWFPEHTQKLKVESATPAELRLLGLYPTTTQPADHTWAYLRTARLRSRPGHADLLHLDLWWRGYNITLDPGTYHYSAPVPWDNPLTAAFYHNTITLDGCDHFSRVSKFLYLDRKDAIKVNAPAGSIAARHYAYAKFGIRHTRTVSAENPNHWQIHDELLNLRGTPHTIRLHWLLPDWNYQVETTNEKIEIRLSSPLGPIALKISILHSTFSIQPSLVRAGETDPLRGWYSPTYAHKLPALSLAVEVQSAEDLTLLSEFIFPF